MILVGRARIALALAVISACAQARLASCEAQFGTDYSGEVKLHAKAFS